MIRGLAALVDASLETVDPTNQAQLKVLADLGQFAVIGTLFHHSTEDDYFWPAIITNGADPAALDSLVREHHEIDPLIEAMKLAFSAPRQPSAATRPWRRSPPPSRRSTTICGCI